MSSVLTFHRHFCFDYKGNEAVILRLDDFEGDDDALRETYRRVKEAYDRLPRHEDDERAADENTAAKGRRGSAIRAAAKRAAKRDRGSALGEEAAISAKLSAFARLATHDVSAL